MKVSNGVHFTKIWVTIATKWRHAPFYIRPNNLSPGIISEIRRGDCLNDAKIVTKSVGGFSRKLRMNFQGVKIQQKQSCFKCCRKLCPQDLTSWHSGLKWKTTRWIFFLYQITMLLYFSVYHEFIKRAITFWRLFRCMLKYPELAQ